MLHEIYNLFQWRIYGGGGPLARSLLTSQNFLNFTQIYEKFGKIVCWRPLQGRRPYYGESWIRPVKDIESLVFLLLFFFMSGSCFRLVCIRYPFLHRRKSNIHKMELFTIFLWIVVLVLSLLLIHFLEICNFRTDPSKICTWTQLFKVRLLRQLNQGHIRNLRSLY